MQMADKLRSAFFNNITYVPQKVPTLYTALTTGNDAENPAVYGEFSHSFVLKKNQIIEIVVNNLGERFLEEPLWHVTDPYTDSGKHPFHLHGHAFQAIARSDEDVGSFDATNSSQTGYPAIPMRRDTLVLRPGGHIVIRFQADNPGIWLFHCHIEWHVDQGLIATMVEAPLELQKTITLPQDHLAACKNRSIPTSGNAAGNTVNHFDLTGANAAPNPLPAGFTARGIVALVFCVISGVLGMAVISWYVDSSPSSYGNVM
jgi:iron transport multicopper oxidase